MAFLSPGYLPELGIELRSPASQADSLPSESPEKPNLLPVVPYLYCAYQLGGHSGTKECMNVEYITVCILKLDVLLCKTSGSCLGGHVPESQAFSKPQSPSTRSLFKACHIEYSVNTCQADPY